MRLRSISRLIAVLAVSLLVLAACAPAAAPAQKAPAPAAPVAPAAKPAPAQEVPKPAPAPVQPKYGGILAGYNAWNPPTLDPLLSGTTQTRTATAGVFNKLLRHDFVETDKIAPDLAEKWEVTPDGLTYTFYLHKDVQWHDGKPFSAADVQSTYDRTKNKAFLAKANSWGKLIFEVASSWKTLDDYTFQITLKNPVPYFLNMLASNEAAITAKHIIDADGDGEKRWVGTGPFKLVKYEEGAILEWIKNPNFFRKGLPYLDGVKRHIIGDRATQVAAMASGRVMVGLQWPANVPSETRLIQEQGRGKVTVLNTYQNAPQKINFQAGYPPLDNVKVRRAIFLAIDRQEIADRVFEGTGQLGVVLDSRVYGDWALPSKEVLELPGIRKNKSEDIAQAKKLLAEAGFPNGFEVVWQVRNTADYIPTASVVAAQLEKIGIKSKIESLDPSAGIQVLNSGKWQLGSTGGGGGFHALTVMRSFIQPTSYANFNVQWGDSNKKLLDMYKEASTTLDIARSKQLVHEMQRYLLTMDAPFFPVVWIDSPVVVWNQVKNYYPAKWGMQEGHDFTIVWLDQ